MVGVNPYTNALNKPCDDDNNTSSIVKLFTIVIVIIMVSIIHMRDDKIGVTTNV
jgi:hypothetical protein